MLIEFSVANFLSIQEKQTLSMVASKSKELSATHTFAAPLKGKAEMKLLPVAAIYGANASGKTNLLVALEKMQRIVVESVMGLQHGNLLPVIPFLLHAASRNAPSQFEATFIAEGTHYQYGFAATEARITEEYLYAYPEGRAQSWFARTWRGDKYEWKLGASLAGEKSLWRKSTRDNALFLSTAVQLNSQQLRPVYDWFKETFCYSHMEGWDAEFSATFCESGRKHKILNILNHADLGIDDVLISHVRIDAKKSHRSHSSIRDEIKHAEEREVLVVHLDTDGAPVAIDLEDESDGTQKIFALAGPWVDSLEKGNVIFFDELHDNLHPELVKFLVRLFNDPKTNPHHAQLIFTTHETSMLNQEILRRDQIWFCEKDKAQATHVYPLTDFHPRKGREDLEAAYLSGRYGALPYVPTMEVQSDE